MEAQVRQVRDANGIKGKTFSSKAAGKGGTGTLEILPDNTIYTNSVGTK